MDERFRKTLDAKVGDWIISKYDSASEERALTKGHPYKIVKAPEECYFNGKICNVFISVINDKGRIVEVPYINFEEFAEKNNST